MRHRAREKIRPHRPRRVRTQIYKLQTRRPHLQGKLRLALKAKMQALGPRGGGLRKSRFKRFNPDACATPIMTQ